MDAPAGRPGEGGLHNRITRRLRLETLTLAEADEYLRARGVRLRRAEVLELYMAIGGIPYYLDLVDRGRSIPQVVGGLCFERGGALQVEFENVFASLFGEGAGHVDVLRAMAKRRQGVTRNEIIESTGMASGGGLNRRLGELEEAGFVGRFEPWRSRVKNTLYRVVDEYSLFYLKWMESAPKGALSKGGERHWQARSRTPSYRAWTGYAFESLCLKHTEELENALGIEGLVEAVGTWRFASTERSPERRGAQVDLLFDRVDGVVDLCEIEFTAEPFAITKAYARELKEKLLLFEQRTRTRKRVQLTLIASSGLRANAWSEDLVDRVVDARALFARTP